jgi:hypothetical protein
MSESKIAPRWIAEAIDAGVLGVSSRRLAAALIERLPIEAMMADIRQRIAGVAGITGDWIGAVAGLAMSGAVHVLTDGDPEVVELAELYLGACRALDMAGVPYAAAYADDGDQQVMPLNLAGRIRWLAQQRPTRLDLQRVEAERDVARAQVAEKDVTAEVTAETIAGCVRTYLAARDRAESRRRRPGLYQSDDADAVEAADSALRAAVARVAAAAMQGPVAKPEVTAEMLTDDDFIAFGRKLRSDIDGLDGAAWQAAQDLRDDCRRARVNNDLDAKIRVAAAINARAKEVDRG